MLSIIQSICSRNNPTIKTPRQFRSYIRKLRKLDIPTPLTDKYEQEHPSPDAWYSNQGEHWEGWLSGYIGIYGWFFSKFTGGSFKRKYRKRSAQFIYNHTMNPGMTLWLAETVGVDRKLILKAITEANKSSSYQTKCRMLREILPWKMVEDLILQKTKE